MVGTASNSHFAFPDLNNVQVAVLTRPGWL